MVCNNCNKEFTISPSQFRYYKGAGKYCSRDCVYKGRVKEFENKPTKDKWGRTRRKADLLWSKAVRERDNYTCQKCGVHNLHIPTHHIATRRRRPDLKHVIENGISLCGSCHSWVHNNPMLATQLGFLSTDSYELAHTISIVKNRELNL